MSALRQEKMKTYAESEEGREAQQQRDDELDSCVSRARLCEVLVGACLILLAASGIFEV